MYRNLVSDFILDKARSNYDTGNQTAVIIFIDIVGFTELTGKFLEQGVEGVEQVSDLINKIFNPSIKLIYSLGGEVISFAGDAFTSIFKESDALRAVYASVKIREIFEKLRAKTKLNILPRIGIAYGNLDWQIVKTRYRNVSYISGDAIIRSTISEKYCKPGEIVIEQNLLNLIRNSIKVTRLNKNYSKLTHLKSNRIKPRKFKKVSRSFIKDFIPKVISNLNLPGEFRNIASVFISFDYKKINQSQLSNLVNLIMNSAYRFGGYFNKLNFGDKGTVILVLFGAPVSQERILQNAADFSLDILNQSPFPLKVGLSSGLVFAGFIGNSDLSEYTAIGEVLNLTSRLMVKAPWNKILVSEVTKNSIQGGYDLEKFQTVKLKGFKESQPIYSLVTKRRRKFKKSKSFIGREEEFRAVLESIKSVSSINNGGILYLHGPAGIGKSKLLEEVQVTLGNSKYNWIFLQCDDMLKESFNPWIRYLNNYFNQSINNSGTKNKRNFNRILNNMLESIDSSELKSELIRTKSILGSLLGISWTKSLFESLTPKGRFDNLKLSIENFVKVLSERKTTIIIIDDAHNIDNDSSTILKRLIPKLKNYPIITIATCRPLKKNEFFNFSIKGIAEQNIQIKPFSSTDVNKILRSFTNKKVGKNLINYIYEKGGGNPFYIDQIYLYLKEKNYIKSDKGGIDLVKTNIRVPTRINNIIIARIDRLENKLKTLVKTASVLGQDFLVKILSEMLRDKDLTSKIQTIEEENILIAVSELKYMFKHALIRDSVYEMNLKKTLNKLHKLAGDTIERLFRDNLQDHYKELIYHYDKAGIQNKTKKILTLAIDHSIKTFKYTDTIHYIRKILEFKLTKLNRLNKIMTLGTYQELLGYWKEALLVYSEGFEFVRESKNDFQIAMFMTKLGVVKQKLGDLDTSKEHLEFAKKIFIKKKKKLWLSNVLNALGNYHFFKSELSDAEGYYNKTLEIMRDKTKNKHVGIALCNLGIINTMKGYYKPAMKYFRKSLKVIKVLNNKYLKGMVIFQMGNVYYYQNNYKTALKYYHQKLKLSRELGDRHGMCYTLGNMGNVYKHINLRDKAIENYKKVLSLSEEIGDLRSVNIALGNIGGFLGEQGKHDESLKYFKKKLKISEQVQNKESILYSYSGLASAYDNLKKTKLAEKYYIKTVDLSREIEIEYELSNSLFLYAAFLFTKGRYQTAKKLCKESVEIAQKINRGDTHLSAKILFNMIIGMEKKNKNKAINDLTCLLKEKLDDQFQGYIYYALFKITKEVKYRKKTIKIYKKLYNEIKEQKYLDRINELN